MKTINDIEDEKLNKWAIQRMFNTTVEVSARTAKHFGISKQDCVNYVNSLNRITLDEVEKLNEKAAEPKIKTMVEAAARTAKHFGISKQDALNYINSSIVMTPEEADKIVDSFYKED